MSTKLCRCYFLRFQRLNKSAMVIVLIVNLTIVFSIMMKSLQTKNQLKVVSNFQITEYQITPGIDFVETELNRKLREAKKFIEHLSSLEEKWLSILFG